MEVWGNARYSIYAIAYDTDPTNISEKILSITDETLNTSTDAQAVADAQLALNKALRPSIRIELAGDGYESIWPGTIVYATFERPTIAKTAYEVRRVERSQTFPNGILKTVVYLGLGETPDGEAMYRTIRDAKIEIQNIKANRLVPGAEGGTPIINHSDTQNKNAEADYQHITTTQKTALHAAVTVSAPIVLTGQAIELKNNAGAPAQVTAIDIDGTLAGNSDAKIATQKAVKTYVDGKGFSDIVSDLTPQLGGNLDPAGYGITGETVAPVRGLFGWGGWADGGNIWYIQCNDADADIVAVFHVKVGGSFKVVVRFDVNNLDETQAGHLFVGNRQAGEACIGYTTYDLIDGTAAFDLNPNGARIDTDQKSAAVTVENDSIVTVKWHKDGAGTAGHYLELGGIYLQRQ